MRHNIQASAFGVRLRPVQQDDASFILKLRLHPRLSRYIGDTSADPQSQEKWLSEYFQRKEDYYFCLELEKSKRPIGTAGIYGIQTKEGKGEWGRWILSPGIMAASASAYLIYLTAFKFLGLKKVYCRTVSTNSKVLSFLDHMGAERYGLDKKSIMIRGELKDMVGHQVTRELWEKIEPVLGLNARLAENFLKDL